MWSHTWQGGTLEASIKQPTTVVCEMRKKKEREAQLLFLTDFRVKLLCAHSALTALKILPTVNNSRVQRR